MSDATLAAKLILRTGLVKVAVNVERSTEQIRELLDSIYRWSRGESWHLIRLLGDLILRGGKCTKPLRLR